MGNRLSETLHGGPIDECEITRVRDTLLFEGDEMKKRLVRFFCLLILASSIATYGLLSDSLAVVIGAMIVAPLMTPIMGLAFSISIGDRRSIATTLMVSVGGIIAAIAVGFVLTYPMVGLSRVEGINQIMIRTAPRLIDLMAALVTGLAGAFALSRKDVSDTLPGVAIAVSLVPPLANVGILLALGRSTLALGSMLLFLTNYFAILLTGSLVFGLMGFSQTVLTGQSARAKRKAIAIAIIAVLLIMIPLSLTSYNLIVVNTITAMVYSVGQEWLTGSGYRLVSVSAETADRSVNLTLLGDGELPNLALLEERLQGKLFERPLRIEIIPSSSYTITP